MNSQKYKEEDLVDSVVVDKEGYICGYVNGFKIEPTNLMISLYGYTRKNEEEIDEKELVKRLMSLVPQKGLLQRQIGEEEFYDWVRETLNLEDNEPITSEHLVKYAHFNSIEIPQKIIEDKAKIDKGSILWSTIEKIAFTDLGKCILLKNIVEAKRKGVVIRDQVDYRDTKDISKKIVIDSEAKIIGSVAKFLVGSPPGILVNIERVTKEQSLNVKNREVVMELPVSWENISKIGDVVILKEPLAILSSSYSSF